jgi:glutamate dehydrogenase (NAD(P)+)
MIPKYMERFLKEVLPERTWRNRLVRENGLCFMEFGPMDVDRLNRLGIHPDRLGPKVVTCLWDEESSLEVGGYLVVDNLAMGRPSMGGIRMLPDLTPEAIFHRARGMTLKNAASNLPYGGGKAGIVADSKKLTVDEHQEVIRRFSRLISHYDDIFLPGPDVGTDCEDMKTVAIQNGIDSALSKPAEMGGAGGQIGAAGGGLVIAMQALLRELPRLRALPQFANLHLPDPDQITVMLQGFGAVGAHTARLLVERVQGAKVIGIGDTSGYLYNIFGLPVDKLFKLWLKNRIVCQPFYQENVYPAGRYTGETKYSNAPEDLLREDAFCFIPAAPVTNYLGTDASSHPSLTVDRMGSWTLILEGANTYSPDPASRAARERMEVAVYRQKGILIATDYLVNSGGVIYAAQENLIKTPARLQIPDQILGDRKAVDIWLAEHAAELQELAKKRLVAAEKAREEVINRNMREFIDLLISDADMLPCEAAENLSIQRITSRERKRTAADIMESAITIPATTSIQEAASLAVETGSPILIVTGSAEELVGVVTDWDITRAASEGATTAQPISKIMTHQVISASPEDSILELVRKLEYHEISAIPVVRDNAVIGIVSTDLLARRSLYPLLISQST